MKWLFNLIYLVPAAFILLLFGCESNSGNASFEEIHSGTNGLVMEFDSRTTPTDTLEGLTFYATMSLQNSGAENIENGLLKIISDDYITVDGKKEIPFKVEGKSKYNLDGEKNIQRFKLKANQLNEESQSHYSQIVGIACYDYSTISVEQACIASQFLRDEDEQEGTCKPEIISTGSQGAPIEVYSIEPRYEEDADNWLKPVFFIRIRNAGDGQVISPGKITQGCSSEMAKEDYGKVKIKALLGEKEMACGSETDSAGIGEIKLSEGEGAIECRLPDQKLWNALPYVSVIQVTLEYGYIDTASTGIMIRKS